MNAVRAFYHVVMAELLRFRASRVLARIDRLMARAVRLKDRAVRHETASAMPVSASFIRATAWLCGLLLAALLIWLVHDAWK